jgi:hypothetical protein
MQTNTSTIDRQIRVLAGFALIALTATSTIGAWGWIGVIALITGLIGWCPLYAMFGIDTRKPLKQADGKPPAHPSA